jgi:hypothetical protein
MNKILKITAMDNKVLKLINKNSKKKKNNNSINNNKILLK